MCSSFTSFMQAPLWEVHRVALAVKTKLLLLSSGIRLMCYFHIFSRVSSSSSPRPPLITDHVPIPPLLPVPIHVYSSFLPLHFVSVHVLVPPFSMSVAVFALLESIWLCIDIQLSCINHASCVHSLIPQNNN